MDLRKPEFFASLSVQSRTIGLNDSPARGSSVMSLVSAGLSALTQERVRADSNGLVEIVIRIRNKPVATDTESVNQMNRASELDALVEGSADSTAPIPNESYEDYYRRLTEVEQLPNATALMLAAEWFQRPVDEQTKRWLSDSKAIRFRELNSRSDAFDAAIPNEYESLKQYVKTHFPEFVEHLTFRTA